MKGVVLAGTSSGVGKTVATLATQTAVKIAPAAADTVHAESTNGAYVMSAYPTSPAAT